MSGNTSGEKPCYLAQPISKLPTELKGMTDLDTTSPIPVNCNGNPSCFDINDDVVAARDENNEPLPQYLVVPYEGCGGDGLHEDCPDIFNSCYAKDTDILKGDFTKATDKCCKGMQVLCHGDDTVATSATCPWPSDSAELRAKFNDYSRNLTVSSQTQWGQNLAAGGKRINWCGGFNMHFDFALAATDLPWNNAKKTDIKRFSGKTNIMMRYKRVECNIWGNVLPPYTDGCDNCDKCVAIPGNTGSVSNEACAPCARGKQTFYPCNVPDTCTCPVNPPAGSRKLADVVV